MKFLILTPAILLGSCGYIAGPYDCGSPLTKKTFIELVDEQQIVYDSIFATSDQSTKIEENIYAMNAGDPSAYNNVQMLTEQWEQDRKKIEYKLENTSNINKSSTDFFRCRGTLTAKIPGYPEYSQQAVYTVEQTTDGNIMVRLISPSRESQALEAMFQEFPQ